MKKVLVLGALLLIPALLHAAGSSSSRSVRRAHSAGRWKSSGGRSALPASDRNFSRSSPSSFGFRGFSGRNLGAGEGEAPAPTYSMIGARVTSPGMFSTQTPIIETRDFARNEAGGIRKDDPAIGQHVNYSRGVFTDPMLSGYGTSSGGYGTFYSNNSK